ncbi:MAG: Unknown protein [uncultured Sulfurovum sp.]|nr:MAG: Unknown protein [uncultured Sulfurovum sp.]
MIFTPNTNQKYHFYGALKCTLRIFQIEGIERGIEKVVVSMLKLNVDIEIIQKSTGLIFEAIEALKKKI